MSATNSAPRGNAAPTPWCRCAGWRWPVVGLTAGIVVLALVSFSLTGLGWSPSDWANPFNALAYGAWSAYPTMLGAVMITVSALRLRSRRTR